ncbi:hypothetical protein TNCV_107951 [Trichonephila clavipes]|nr:hypothetical protein TNCV_107951 [Trichonephila clavipes]
MKLITSSRKKKRKAEIAEQSSNLDQQIAAWGLPLKPLENPFQVVLNKKSRKNLQMNDSLLSRSLPKKARTDNVASCSDKFDNLMIDDPPAAMDVVDPPQGNNSGSFGSKPNDPQGLHPSNHNTQYKESSCTLEAFTRHNKNKTSSPTHQYKKE